MWSLHPSVLRAILEARSKLVIEFDTDAYYKPEEDTHYIRMRRDSIFGSMLHELMHAYEASSDKFFRAERELWDRRTAGRQPSRETWWFGKISTIRDRWINTYAGRYYGGELGRHLECCSTTMSKLVEDFSWAIARDPDTSSLIIRAMFEGEFEE